MDTASPPADRISGLTKRRASFAANVDELVAGLGADSRRGDHIVVMSNGGFGGLHDKLLAVLRARQ